MNTCCKCRTEFNGNFCPTCGTKYEPQIQYTCCKCRTAFSGNFCPNCGTKYNPVAPPQSQANHPNNPVGYNGYNSNNIQTQKKFNSPFVAAVCTCCGAALTVDKSKDAAICQFCGMPFVVEKAISNVTMVGNNNLAIESAIINIQSGNASPSVDNLLKRAEEFEQQGNFVTAVEYYEKVLDLDCLNSIARESINRIINSRILSIPADVGLIRGSLSLTRKSLTYQTKRKIEIYSIESIITVERFVARLIIRTNNRQAPLDLSVGSVKDAKAMEKALKELLATKQYFKQ